jgi:hypothetical protein
VKKPGWKIHNAPGWRFSIRGVLRGRRRYLKLELIETNVPENKGKPRVGRTTTLLFTEHEALQLSNGIEFELENAEEEP